MSKPLFPGLPKVVQPLLPKELALRLLDLEARLDKITEVAEQVPVAPGDPVDKIYKLLAGVDHSSSDPVATVFGIVGLTYSLGGYLEGVVTDFFLSGQAEMEVGDKCIGIETHEQLYDALIEARAQLIGPLRLLAEAGNPLVNEQHAPNEE